MKLMELFENMSHPPMTTKMDDAILTHNYLPFAMMGATGNESFTHHLSDPFVIEYWRNTPDNRVILYHDAENAYVELFDEWMKKGITHLHSHDFIEIAYVVYGEFSQMIGGQKHTFSKGSVCIIDRNSQHCDYVGLQDNFVVFLCMKEDFFSELFISEIDDSNVQQFIRKALLTQKNLKQFLHFVPRDEDHSIFQLIEMIVTENSDKNKGSMYIIKGLMIRIFDILTKHYELSLTTTQIKLMNDLLFVDVENFLRNNYKDASLNDLVQLFHFQEDYFTRLIKKNTGMTYSQLLKKIRVSKAEELLLDTRMSINDIMEAVGYENRHHFYKVFYEFHSMTPKQYRQDHRSSNLPDPT